MAHRGIITLLLLLATAAVSHGGVQTTLYGAYQGFDLAVAPPVGPTGDGNPNSPCYVQGVPTSDGFSPLAVGPVALDTPQGTGEHTVKLLLASGYSAVNVLISNPSSATLLRAGPDFCTFNANLGGVGDSGSTFWAIIYNGAQVCLLTVSYKIVPGINCPGYGGGAVVNPGPGTVYYPPGNTVVVNPAAQTYITQITQVYQTVYNINIQQVNNYFDNRQYNDYSCTGCCYGSCNLIVNDTGYIRYPPPQALPPTYSPVPIPAGNVPPPGSGAPAVSPPGPNRPTGSPPSPSPPSPVPPTAGPTTGIRPPGPPAPNPSGPFNPFVTGQGPPPTNAPPGSPRPPSPPPPPVLPTLNPASAPRAAPPPPPNTGK